MKIPLNTKFGTAANSLARYGCGPAGLSEDRTIAKYARDTWHANVPNQNYL